MIYYPAPIPVQLRLPPLLSKKNKKRATEIGNSNINQQNNNEPSSHYNFNPNRASAILPPPTWNIQAADRNSMLSLGQVYPRQRQSVYSLAQTVNTLPDGASSIIYMEDEERSGSPALSMDSGRATIQSDDEDYRQELDPVDNKDEDGADEDDTTKKSKHGIDKPKKKKRQGPRPKRLLIMNQNLTLLIVTMRRKKKKDRP